jgi:hypothetical protein
MSIGETDPFLLLQKKNKRDSKIWAQTQLILFEFERRWNSKTMSCAELKLKSLSEWQVWESLDFVIEWSSLIHITNEYKSSTITRNNIWNHTKRLYCENPLYTKSNKHLS